MNTPANTKANAATDDLGQQIETLRADFVKLAATISDDVSGEIGKAGRQVAKTSRDAQATATNAVLDHPLTAVGIAAAVGLLLGLLTRRS